jgi:alpha-1,2-mannosyltransferase
LWKMIQVLQAQQQQSNNNNSNKQCIIIYTIDPPSTDEAQLRRDAERRFDVVLTQPVKLISLYDHKDYLLPSPYLSLVLESLGTMKLAYRALTKLKVRPDVFCDTTGCAFTFAVVRWMCPQTYILAYVHYPTISTDMMLWEWKQQQQQQQQQGDHHHHHRPKWKTYLKLVYYWMFAVAYGLVGSLADLVLVNSTWTYNHIRSLWRLSKQIHIVYPPCRVPTNVETNNNNNNNNATAAMATPPRQNTIVSIGQFRPEKNHKLQIESLARLLELHPEYKDDNNDNTNNTNNSVKLLLIGSCRNDDDRGRVTELQTLVEELRLTKSVEFSINPPYSELQQHMHSASMGIHTMRQEHFGIGIVEMMAAGLLTIAHDSGGPRTDIVEHGVSGYLATTADDYVNAIHRALSMSDAETTNMRQKAQESATRFSDQVFDESFGKVLQLLWK